MLTRNPLTGAGGYSPMTGRCLAARRRRGNLAEGDEDQRDDGDIDGAGEEGQHGGGPGRRRLRLLSARTVPRPQASVSRVLPGLGRRSAAPE